MKSIRILSFTIVILAVLIVGVDDTLANWYAGARRTVDANGITALISTPNDPLFLVEIPLSGESNWVSTYDIDQNGKRDWLQAGWKMYHWYSIPKQYVEWCIDCIGDQGTRIMKDEFATQSWGTTIDYWVSRDTGSRWCAYTDGLLRFCVDNLHPGPVEILVSSEVHTSALNELNTTFDEIRYKDPNDNIFKLFDSQISWFEDFPYQLDIYSNYHFRTYRSTANDIYLPLIIK